MVNVVWLVAFHMFFAFFECLLIMSCGASSWVVFVRVVSQSMSQTRCLTSRLEGLFLAQYKILRQNGHSPSEAFNETVEEATQSLYPLIGQKG